MADLKAQHQEIEAEVHSAVLEVLKSGRYVLGEYVQQLENRIAQFSGARFGIGVASGTDAILLSLVACDIGPGDEVITTPFTFVATVEVMALRGARPAFVDIDPCTYNLDHRQVEKKLTSRTKAILPVDLYGQMAARKPLIQIAQQYNLRLIADSAQAIGAKQNGLGIGEYGDVATLSFYPTKNLGGCGDGGMILTHNEEIEQRTRLYRNHGSGGKYSYSKIGYCSRLDEIQAAILLAKMKLIERWNEQRQKNANRYRQLLAGSRVELPYCAHENYHTYHQFTIRHSRRDELQEFLRQNGVSSAVYYPHPLHLEEAYRYLGYKPGDFPESERAAKEVLSLPIHPELTEEQIAYVTEMIFKFERRNDNQGSIHSDK